MKRLIEKTRTSRVWLYAAGVCVGGWLVGMAAFQNRNDTPVFAASDTWIVFAPVTLIVAMAVSLPAGYLRGRGRLRVGTWHLLGGSAFLGLVLVFSGFTGMCLDPGDKCLPNAPDRLLPIGVAIAVLVLGAYLENRLACRRMSTSD